MPRALATLETISEVRPHDNADALELATVRGWQVVIRIGEVAAGDTVVFFEIDTMLDVSDERFAFLAPRGVRTDVRDGFQGHVLRTARLRGQLSQGLVVPAAQFPEVAEAAVGDDVTEALGLRKWDPPLPAALSGSAIGARPGLVPKTDAERVQNVELSALPSEGWVASEKVDGMSTSYLLEVDGELRVCTRNLELANAGQSQWRLADALDLDPLMRDLLASSGAASVVIQGEVAGPRLQGNPLQLADLRFFAFRLVVDGSDVATQDWPEALMSLAAPLVDVAFPASSQEALDAAEAFESVVAPGRRPEGIVWRYEGDELVTERVLKAISNRYLLKQ